jgi:hypothetical protein
MHFKRILERNRGKIKPYSMIKKEKLDIDGEGEYFLLTSGYRGALSCVHFH